MRAVIWAGVSSRPQVEDKDSLPRQLEEGEQLCQRNGWQIVGRLQVPGASRNYVDLADAIEGLDDDLRRLQLDVPNAYRELAQMIAGRQLDVLVVRSRDRLARTDSLIAGIEERLRRIGATLYSMAMPPSGHLAGDLYVSAVERASAQHEIERLRDRHRKGMDDRFSRGHVLSGPVPFPYIEELNAKGRKPVRYAVPDPLKKESYLWAVHATLTRSHTAVEIGDRLSRSFPDLGFAPPKVRDMLRNSVPVGLIIRRRVVQEGEMSPLIVYTPLDTPYWPEIESLLLRRAEHDRTELERKVQTPKVWLVTRGQHEPIIDPETWLELQRMLDTRAAGRRPPSRTRLWSSLLWCARCGSRMYATTSKKSPGRSYGAYICSERFLDRSDCNNPQVPETFITEQMVTYLDELVVQYSPQSKTALAYNPRKELERQRATIEERRKRLIILFETGRIELDAYDIRLAELHREQSRIQHEINTLEEKDAREARLTRNLDAIRASVPRTVLAGDPAEANRWLRNLIVKVWVDDRKVVNVEL